MPKRGCTSTKATPLRRRPCSWSPIGPRYDPHGAPVTHTPTRPLESCAGNSRTLTLVQLSRGRSATQNRVRLTTGGAAQDAPDVTCAKKRAPSLSGRASILKKGLAPQSLPSLAAFCLIWWMTVRHGSRPPAGRSRGQSPDTLKEKRYQTISPNLTSSPPPLAPPPFT